MEKGGAAPRSLTEPARGIWEQPERPVHAQRAISEWLGMLMDRSQHSHAPS